jgi:hypothetical protein
MRVRKTNRRPTWALMALSGVLAVGTLALAEEAEDRDAKRKQEAPKAAESKGTAASEGLSVRSITLATGYEEGEPVGESETFSTGRIYAVIDVENRTGGPSEIRVAWVPEGKKVWKGMPLEIAAQRRFRTVAMTWATPRDPGAYRVVVRDTEGETLAEKSFNISR